MGTRQGGRARKNNCSGVKDGEMSARKVRGNRVRREGGDEGKEKGIEILQGCTKRGNT